MKLFDVHEEAGAPFLEPPGWPGAPLWTPWTRSLPNHQKNRNFRPHFEAPFGARNLYVFCPCSKYDFWRLGTTLRAKKEATGPQKCIKFEPKSHLPPNWKNMDFACIYYVLERSAIWEGCTFSLIFSSRTLKLFKEGAESTFLRYVCDFWAFWRLQLHHFWPRFFTSKFRACAFLHFTFLSAFLTTRKRIGGTWLRSLG